MRRTLTIVLGVMVALVFVMGSPLAIAQPTEAPTDLDVEPGEQLAGAISVTDAEIDGEIEERAFGLAIANAATEDEKAEIIAEKVNNVSDRVDDLDERLADLEDKREAGEISQGQYAAEVAQIEAERATVERQAAQVVNASADLPEEMLSEHGVNVTAIHTIQENASELTGPEIAEIAKSIAGDNVGQSIGGDPLPVEPGPPDDDEDDGDNSTPGTGQSP